jgi:hypothetical protein
MNIRVIGKRLEIKKVVVEAKVLKMLASHAEQNGTVQDTGFWQGDKCITLLASVGGSPETGHFFVTLTANTTDTT